jgi:hypothetical protein
LNRESPENFEDLHQLAKLAADTILKVKGIKYRFGQTSSVIRRTIAGSSSDFALMLGIQYAITFEVSQYKKSGFHPPKTKILEKCEELWIGVETMANFVIDKFREEIKESQD